MRTASVVLCVVACHPTSPRSGSVHAPALDGCALATAGAQPHWVVLGADCDPARRAEDIAATVPTSRTTRAFVDGPRATGTLTELASATELRAAFGCVPPDLDLRRDHVWVASWESSPEVAEVPWSFVHAGGYATLGLRVENVPCHGDNRGDSRDARLVFAAPAGETAELVRCPAPPRGACGEVP